MKLTTILIRLLVITLVYTGLVYPQKPCQPALPESEQDHSQNSAAKKLLLVADNQEHNLMGVQLPEMGTFSDRITTSVAMRQPLSHVGGRLLLREVLKFGKERKTDLVLHLGDASNVSCPEEFSSVFDLLDKEAGNAWFMAPGNHDGIRIGTYVKQQPAWKEDVPADYGRPISEGRGRNKQTWFNACQAPASLEGEVQKELDVKGILHKGDAIMLYAKRLKDRGAKVTPLESVPVRVADTDISCKVEQLDLESHNYTAVTQICPAVQLKKNPSAWVGPYASYIIQKLEVAGTRIIMLDTSNYKNPMLYNVAMKGGLTWTQRTRVQKWFDGVDRKNVVIIGHHPIDDFPKGQERWIIERAARYISAHVHRTTQLINHKSKRDRTLELNIASTVDYPPQAALATIDGPTSMSFEVAGAEAAFPGFLSKCVANSKQWKLEPSLYKDYRSGAYVDRLLDSLREAALKHTKEVGPLNPNFQIPLGTELDGWQILKRVLENINAAEDETSRTFWACQAYYASQETQGLSFLERVRIGVGLGQKSGCDATGSRFAFHAL